MVTINITDKNKEPLRFILTMFLETHEQDKVIYPEEILIAKRILKKLNTSENKPKTNDSQDKYASALSGSNADVDAQSLESRDDSKNPDNPLNLNDTKNKK